MLAGGGALAGIALVAAKIFAPGRRGGFRQGQWRSLQAVWPDREQLRAAIAIDRKQGVERAEQFAQRTFAAQPDHTGQRQIGVKILDHIAEQLRQIERGFIGDHLERQIGNAVAKVGQLQVFEHGIGQSPVGRATRRAFGGGQQRIGRLIARAAVQAEGSAHFHIAGRAAQQLAVGPDPADRADRPAAERHRETGSIRIIGDRGAAFAAALLFAVLGQIGRPDDLSRHAHPPEMARQRHPVA